LNKKASFFETLPRILLILVVVLLILIGGGSLLWNAGKSLLSSFGLINISETDYSRLNQEARTNFDTLISDIKNCKNSIDDNCLCYTSLSSFYETHEIEINNQEIKLLDVKEGNEITMAKETIENLNCYYTDSINVENSFKISFDENLPRIGKSAIGVDFLSQDINFFKNPALYKNNRICLTSTSFDLTKGYKACTLKQ